MSSAQFHDPARPDDGYDIMISIPAADEQLGWGLYYALRRPPGPGGKEGVYYYRALHTPKHSINLAKEWDQACGRGNPFFVVVETADYCTDLCRHEAETINQILRAAPSDKPFRRLAHINLLPPGTPSLLVKESKFEFEVRPAHDVKEIDKIVDAVCDLVATALHKLGETPWFCKRAHLAQNWWLRPDAAADFPAPAYPENTGQEDVETCLGLAAAVGMVEQLSRGLRVVYKLDDLHERLRSYLTILSNSKCKFPMSLNDLKGAIGRLLDEFPYRSDWHYHPVVDCDSSRAPVGRLRNYIKRHLEWRVNNDQLDKFAEFLTEMHKQSDIVKSNKKGIQPKLEYLDGFLATCINLLGSQLPVPERQIPIKPDQPLPTANTLCRDFGPRLKKAQPYHGTV